MKLSDFTILICSYKQLEVLKYTLKSIVANHPNEQLNLLIVENSDDPEIYKFLDDNKIP